MKVTNAFLANHAEIRDSLVFASGAFPEWWMIPNLTMAQPLAFVATIEMEGSEIGKTYNFILGLEAPEAATTGLAFFTSRRDLVPDETTDAPIYNIFALNFLVPFGTVGLHHFVLSISQENGIEEIARVPLLVKIASSAASATAKADVKAG